MPFPAGWWLPGMDWSRTGCLNAVAWLLSQPENAVTVQELVGLYRSAPAALSGPYAATCSTTTAEPAPPRSG